MKDKTTKNTCKKYYKNKHNLSAICTLLMCLFSATTMSISLDIGDRFIPRNDSETLLILKEDSFYVFKKNNGLNPIPKNTFLKQLDAIDHLIQQSQLSGDDKYLGQASILLNELTSQSPAFNRDLVIRLAKIEQRLHHFSAASDKLNLILEKFPLDTEASLLLAYIEMAQGNYKDSEILCKKILLQSNTLFTASCYFRAKSLTSEPLESYKNLQQLLQSRIDNSASSAEEEIDAYTTLAEISIRIDNLYLAEKHLKKLLHIDPGNIPAQSMLADIYISQKSYKNVYYLLKNATHPTLKTKLLLAEQTISKNKKSYLYRDLEKTYKTIILRDEGVASRDETLFWLGIAEDKEMALERAKVYWQHQKEPDDTLWYLKSAIKNKSHEDIEKIKQWVNNNDLQDERIQQVLHSL